MFPGISFEESEGLTRGQIRPERAQSDIFKGDDRAPRGSFQPLSLVTTQLMVDFL